MEDDLRKLTTPFPEKTFARDSNSRFLTTGTKSLLPAEKGIIKETRKSKQDIYAKDGSHYDSSSSTDSAISKATIKKERLSLSTRVKFLEHKFIQCNIVDTLSECVPILAEEIKPFLISLNLLIHELKQCPEQSKGYEELCGLVWKVTKIVTELCRRNLLNCNIENLPENWKNLESAGNELQDLLQKHDRGSEEIQEGLIADMKRLEKILLEKNIQISILKDKVQEQRKMQIDDSEDLFGRLRNSILENQKLKAEIAFNQIQFRKYKKAISDRENLKNKLQSDLQGVQKRIQKSEVVGEVSADAASSVALQSEVGYGGTVTKYIKANPNQKGKKGKP